jgi:anti-anti-sigma regulatory factor
VFTLTGNVGWAPARNLSGIARKPATLDVRVDFNVRRVTAHGEIVLATLGSFCDLMSLLVEVNPGDTILDLSDVHRIDGAGFGCLVQLHERLIALGAVLTIAAAAPHRDRLFDIANLVGMPVAGGLGRGPAPLARVMETTTNGH